MITPETTKVYVRVDLASQRVIGVSADSLKPHDGKPVFEVAANFDRLDYYIVEKNASATFGITVRAANATERTAADAVVAATTASIIQKTKTQKVSQIKELYMKSFMKRFAVAGFECAGDLSTVVSYSGTDTNVLNNIKPLAITIENALTEWRFNVCQPVIGIIADTTGTGVDITDAYRASVEDTLDTFLTEHGFDIATYHR